MSAALPAGPPAGRRWSPVVALGLFTLTAAAALTWAKWQPYTHKLAALWQDGTWSGRSIVDDAGTAGAAPDLSRGWSFTVTYFEAVWVALLAALVISAAVEALVPGRWLQRLLRRGGHAGAVRGGLVAMPSMMCTCCAAPITKTLRRQGASTSAAVAYWLGNPAINPAVLAFLVIVAPWQWAVTRAVGGLVLVFVVSSLVARLAIRRRDENPAGPGEPAAMPTTEVDLRTTPRRFLGSLGRLSVTLLPEYLLVIFAVGTFRGWLFPLDGGVERWGPLAVLIVAVVGTLMVIPTAGEIPIMFGLAAVGVGAAPLGALLVTLPAISLPSMLMVGRILSWRVTLAAGGAVVLVGLGTAGLLTAIS